MTDKFLVVCADRHARFVVDRFERADSSDDSLWRRVGRKDGTYGSQPIFAGETPTDPGKVYDDGLVSMSAPDRWREPFRCKACRRSVPARQEVFFVLISRMFDAGAPEIQLVNLDAALRSVKRT